VTRESTLADLQTGLASLTDDELALARLWLVGEALEDICYILKLREKKVRMLWQSMRRKVRFALLDEAERAAEALPPATPDAPPHTGTPKETEGTSPV
jgi:DNA-binding CsgD family transcriptional regulator